MHIGIIVYSQTGHTLSVAAKLKEKLAAAGHEVNLKRVETTGPVRPGTINVTLATKPEIATYDALVFGTPVQGGVPASPMASYLAQLASLQGKKSRLFSDRLFSCGVGPQPNDRPDQRDLCIQRGDDLRSGKCGMVFLFSQAADC